MKIQTILITILLLIATGCSNNDGMFENAGESLDDTTDNVSDSMEETGDAIEDSAEDTKNNFD